MTWRRVGIQDHNQNSAVVTPEGALTVALGSGSVELEFPDSMDVNVTNESLPVQVEFPDSLDVTVINDNLPVQVEFPTEALDVNVVGTVSAVLEPGDEPMSVTMAEEWVGVQVGNESLNVEVSNDSFDVNVTNTSLPVVVSNTSFGANITNASVPVHLSDVTDVAVPDGVTVSGTVATYPGADPAVTAIYAYTLHDVSGVSAAYNHLAFYNPPTSTRAVCVLSLRISSYNVGITGTGASMHVSPITTSASGSQVTNTQIVRQLGTATPMAILRTANATATISGVAAFAATPPIAGLNQASQSTLAVVASAQNPGILLSPGQGLVFRTNSGDTSQRWNISLVWSERTV